MSTKTIYIPLTEEFKKEAVDIVNETIEKTAKEKNVVLDLSQKRKIRNLSLDQINVNVTHKNSLTNLWVFSDASYFPVIITTNKKDIPEDSNKNVYRLKSNGTWEIADHKLSMNKKRFEASVLRYLIKDFETAAFYGTLSYWGEMQDDE